MSRRQKRPDEAADTVIGFILITAVSLGAIALVLLSGGPTLDRIQSQQELDSMVRFMGDLDHGISTLLSGAPAGSTPVWTVSMPRGSIELQDDGHMWAYVVNKEVSGNQYDVVFSDFGDGDDTFSLAAQGQAIGTLDIDITSWDGSSDTAEAFTTTVSGGTITVDLDEDMRSKSLQVEVFDTDASSTKPIAEGWFIDAGAVVWQSAGNQILRVTYQNTAIIADVDEGEVFHNSPRIRGPQDKGQSDEGVFLRVIKFDGTLSVAGRQTVDVLLSGGGNHPRHSASDVTSVDLYPPDRFQQAWVGEDCSNPTGRLANENLGYTYDVQCNPMDATLEPFARRASSALGSGELSATLVETPVRLQGVTAS